MSDSGSLLEQFQSYGPCEVASLSRIQTIGGKRLSDNWASIPHVTHQEIADVTVLEQRRKDLAAEQAPVKVTALAFHVKAVVKTLQAFPKFNASLDSDGASLVLKQYYHIGFAVDTPNGLLVPVIRDCDHKSVVEIAAEVAELSERARTKGLPLQDMTGGSFSISSLGRNGGTGFSPIINAPEVAILGISRLLDWPFRGDEDAVLWRQVVPLSLSYDHRVINGADASEFMTHLRGVLAQPEQLI